MAVYGLLPHWQGRSDGTDERCDLGYISGLDVGGVIPLPAMVSAHWLSIDRDDMGIAIPFIGVVRCGSDLIRHPSDRLHFCAAI